MEDEETLEALGRVLSGKGPACANLGETQLQELATRGESLIQGAGDGDSQTEEFRSLFLDTWQTLRETVTAWGVTPKAVALFVGLAQEYRRADYDRGYDFYGQEELPLRGRGVNSQEGEARKRSPVF